MKNVRLLFLAGAFTVGAWMGVGSATRAPTTISAGRGAMLQRDFHRSSVGHAREGVNRGFGTG